MKRTVTDIVVHVCFFTLLWLGWIHGVAGARNFIAFWVGLKIVESLLMVLSGKFAQVATAGGLGLPYNLVLFLAFGSIGFFAWHGAYWLAAAHTFNTIVFIGLYYDKRGPKGIQA